jgi:hypothetical protein
MSVADVHQVHAALDLGHAQRARAGGAREHGAAGLEAPEDRRHVPHGARELGVAPLAEGGHLPAADPPTPTLGTGQRFFTAAGHARQSLGAARTGAGSGVSLRRLGVDHHHAVHHALDDARRRGRRGAAELARDHGRGGGGDEGRSTPRTQERVGHDPATLHGPRAGVMARVTPARAAASHARSAASVWSRRRGAGGAHPPTRCPLAWARHR